MAVYINTLIGGNITIGSGGSAPAARTATRVWYGDDPNVYTDYEIEGYIEGSIEPTTQISNVENAKKIEIGSSVYGINNYSFINCYNLTDIIIPYTV